MAFIIKPIVTEKLNELSEKQNKFGFVVKPTANKLQIKAEVEARYGVTVTDVNTMVYAGKFFFASVATGLFDVVFETSIEVFADLAIFENAITEVRTTEPVGVPTADDAKSVGDRINLLSHFLF